jgi:hypothetical protein
MTKKGMDEEIALMYAKTMNDSIKEYMRTTIQKKDIFNQNGANLVYLHGKDMANKLNLTPQEKLGVTPFPTQTNISVMTPPPPPPEEEPKPKAPPVPPPQNLEPKQEPKKEDPVKYTNILSDEDEPTTLQKAVLPTLTALVGGLSVALGSALWNNNLTPPSNNDDQVQTTTDDLNANVGLHVEGIRQ